MVKETVKTTVKTQLVEVPKHTDVALVASINNGFQLGRYSKLIAVVLSNVLAIFLGWLAVQFPQIATCAPGPDGVEACTVFGIFSQAQITAALMFFLSNYAVYKSPANDPPA